MDTLRWVIGPTLLAIGWFVLSAATLVELASLPVVPPTSISAETPVNRDVARRCAECLAATSAKRSDKF